MINERYFMIFNGVEYCEFRDDYKKYKTPKLKIGDAIKLLFDDEVKNYLPGCKKMKKGEYVVIDLRKSFQDDIVYDLRKKGSKNNVNGIYFIAIDKAIEAGAILISF